MKIITENYMYMRINKKSFYQGSWRLLNCFMSFFFYILQHLYFKISLVKF